MVETAAMQSVTNTKHRRNKMISKNDIKNAKNRQHLREILDQAAFERNCELNDDSYVDQSKFFLEEAQKEQCDDLLELSELLRIADKVAHDLDQIEGD